MREIKFRAWDTEDSVLHDPVTLGDLIQSDAGKTGGFYRHEPKKYTWMQFTGLYDKNGVEVFEGDIIRFTETDEDSCCGAEDTHIVVVEWIDDISQWRCVYSSGRRRELHLVTDFPTVYKCDVIGNIYEHPELLTS